MSSSNHDILKYKQNDDGLILSVILYPSYWDGEYMQYVKIYIYIYWNRIREDCLIYYRSKKEVSLIETKLGIEIKT